MTVAAISFYKKLYPRQTVLVCSQHGGRKSIITLDWHMPASFRPFLVAIAVGKTRYSHELISNSKEFVLSIPTFSMRDAVLYCGSHSGREVADKWKASGLTPLASKKAAVPGIKEAIANFECRTVGEFDAGDHSIFVGEVVEVSENDEAAGEKKILDLGGREFVEL